MSFGVSGSRTQKTPSNSKPAAQAPAGKTTGKPGAPASAATQAPAGKTTAKKAPDVFKQVATSPGAFSMGPTQASSAAAPAQSRSPMSGEANKIAQEVLSNKGARQAYNNFDWKGYNKKVEDVANKVGEEASKLVMEGKLPADKLSDFIDQRIAAAGLPTPPQNPDQAKKPEGAFDWKGYDAAMNHEVDSRMKPILEDFKAGKIDAAQLEKLTAKAGADADKAMAARYPNVPQVDTPPSPQQANYPYAARDAATTKMVDQEMEKVLPQILSGKLSGPELEKVIKDIGTRVDKAMDAQFKPIPEATPPSAANDTKANYDQSRWHMDVQMQKMEAAGGDAGSIQAYKVMREAELAQMFPKQSLLNATREEWKAVATQMAANGRPDSEIQNWLKQKEASFKDPSPEEVAVFANNKMQQAAEMQSLLQMFQQQRARAAAAQKPEIPW